MLAQAKVKPIMWIFRELRPLTEKYIHLNPLSQNLVCPRLYKFTSSKTILPGFFLSRHFPLETFFKGDEILLGSDTPGIR